jgi:hypothetical protein
VPRAHGENDGLAARVAGEGELNGVALADGAAGVGGDGEVERAHGVTAASREASASARAMQRAPASSAVQPQGHGSPVGVAGQRRPCGEHT